MENIDKGSDTLTNADEIAEKAKEILCKGGFFSSFDGGLAELFCKYALARNRIINQYYPFLGAIGLLLFIFADRIILPQVADEILWTRLIGVTFIGFLVFALGNAPSTNSVRTYRSHQLALCIGTLIIHLILIRIGIIAAGQGEYHYQNGTTIAVIFLCNVLRVDFKYILPTVLTMWISHIYVTAELLNASESQIIEQLFIYSLIAFISCLVNARMEHEVRKTFLQGIVLGAEQAKLEQAKNRLQQLSVSDELTGLFNRRGFSQFFSQKWSHAIRYQTPLTMLMIDIDYFKQYNDNLGHPKGDDALRQVANILNHRSRRPDDLCARWGGEEFVMLLPQTEMEAGKQLAENLRSLIWSENIFHPCGIENRLTISIGIATVTPKPLYPMNQLLEEADNALYKAKASGRNCIHVYSSYQDGSIT